MDDDNNLSNLPSQEPVPPKEPEKSSRFWNRAATVARIGRAVRFVYENTSVDKLVDTIKVGKDVYDAVREENRAAQAEGREPRPVIEIVKSTGTEWLKKQLDDIATPIARDEDVTKTPYYWKAESKRLAELQRTEQELNTEYQKISRKILDPGDRPEHYKTVSELESKVEGLRQPSIAESLSRTGYTPHWQEEENKRFTDAARKAEQFRKQYLVGTAAEKYQYFLDTARNELGRNVLDRRTNPEAVLKLERLATEYLYTSGYNLPEITAAVRQKSPFITGMDEGKYINTVTERFNRSYPTAELDKARHDLLKWRAEHGISIDDRRTPQEHELAGVFREKVIKQEAEALLKNKYENSLGMLEKYRANPDMELSTKENYQIDLGRRLKGIPASSFNFREQDKQITFSMLLARHKPGEIAKALDEAALVKSSNNYGLEIVKEVLEEMKTNPVVPQVRMQLKEYMDKGVISPDETRLDKLGFHFRQSVSEKDLPKNLYLDRSHDWLER